MKKVVSILMALLVLLSTLHVTVASHYCHGTLAAANISLTGHQPGCGMEEAETPSADGLQLLPQTCCNNIASVFSVDNNYTPSQFQIIKELQNSFVYLLAAPQIVTTNQLASYKIIPNISPQALFKLREVPLDFICVFRV
jgi:hypothetical protein